MNKKIVQQSENFKLLSHHTSQNTGSYLSFTTSKDRFNPFKEMIQRRYGSIRFQLMDFNSFIYLSLVGVALLVFRNNIYSGIIYSILHFLIAIALLELLRCAHKYEERYFLNFFRFFYPIGILAFGWNTLTDLVPMIYGNYWATDIIVKMDKIIFGIHPTVWVQSLYRPWLDEMMNFCYSGYYFFMPIITISLYLKKKYQGVIFAFSLATFCYFGNYILYYLFPTLGPQMIPELNELHTFNFTGYFFADFTRAVQMNGGITGGAFPSSHISGAVIWSIISTKYLGKMGIFISIMTMGVTISTVYLGFHHAMDSIFGLIWGFMSYFMVSKLMSKSHINF